MASRRMPPPIFIVHVQCPPEVEKVRLRERGRPQERGAPLEFLATLNAEIERRMAEIAPSQDILTIDSAVLDFRPGGADRDRVAREVLARL